MNTAQPASTVAPAYLFARHWPSVLVHGLLSLSLGAATISLPVATAGPLARLFGLAAVVEGLLIARAGHSRYRLLPRSVALALALPCLVIGLLAMLAQLPAASTLLLVTGWLLLAGMYRILAALRMLRAAGSSALLLCSGLLTVAMGAMLALHPLIGLALAMAWFGLLAMPAGMLQLLLAANLWRHQPVYHHRH